MASARGGLPWRSMNVAKGSRAANRNLANFKLCMPIVGGSTRPSAAIRSRDWSVIRASARLAIADRNCVHVSERTRREMGTGRNITVLPPDGKGSQDSSRRGYLGDCILQPDSIGRVDLLIISLLIACPRRQHTEFFKRHVGRRPPLRKNLDAPSKSVGPSLRFSPPFPNLNGQAWVDYG